MTAFNRGDVVLVGFVFADESGRKLRPAVVLSTRAYQRARQEVIVAAITSNVRQRLADDHLSAEWKKAGLLFPSVTTGILRTIKQTMIDRRLGAMTMPDLDSVELQLRRSLDL